MPARKPKALITRHETAAEQREREARESAMQPEKGLPMSAPARLAGHAVAEATWRRLMRTFDEIEGVIVTRLDMDLLIDYCMVTEQLAEMDMMRTTIVVAWKKAEDVGDTDKLLELLDAASKLDARIDRKRALLFQMRQSLYLTPRARAGVAPAKKEDPEPPDELEQLLNEANGIVNGDR